MIEPEKEVEIQSATLMDKLKLYSRNFFDSVDNYYQKFIRTSLTYRKEVIISVVGFAVLSFALFKFVETEFFPNTDESQFTVSVKLPVGTRLEKSVDYIKRVEALIWKDVPETKTII